MRPSTKRRLWLGLALLAVLVIGLPLGIWQSLQYEPAFYRQRSKLSRDQQRANADRFVAQSLQLRNDIANEGRWEATFSEAAVNAWLTEDLLNHFAQELPEGFSEPLVNFHLDRVTFAFQWHRGPVSSLIWGVARARVSGKHTLALSIEKLRAGAVPIPIEDALDRVVAGARARGFPVYWAMSEGQPVAFIRYSPEPDRSDVVLERVQVLDGQLFISGRSDREAGRVSEPTLPDRRVLQMKFPNRTRQSRDRDRSDRSRSSSIVPPSTFWHSSATAPVNRWPWS